MGDLEAELLDDVEEQLARWRVEHAGDADAERNRLLLLALEREQIVAVAYREEVVAARVDALDLAPEIRALIRQTLVWIWKDEELHAAYIRGLLLGRKDRRAALVIYGRQLQGVLSGWVTSTRNHVDARHAPLRSGAASLLVLAAGAMQRMPPALAHELHFQTFKRYCDLNVALEATAELAYRRLVDLAAGDEERAVFPRILGDERDHMAAFRVIAGALTDDDRLAPGWTFERLLAELSSISEWFVPAPLRADAAPEERPRRFGRGGPVVVRGGTRDSDRLAVLDECLDRAGLAELAAGSGSAAIRVSFMLGYDRADRSNVNDPVLVDGLARYLRRHGVRDVAVIEAPTVYETCFEHRTVAEVAEYFGFTSDAYRVVDIGADLRPVTFGRGFVQQAVSATWLDADLRIVMPKLRTDPTEFAHLSLSTLEGSTGAIDETFYASRRVDFRSATMMLLDVAPSDFAVVDAWGPRRRRAVRRDGLPHARRDPLRVRGCRCAGGRRDGPRRPRGARSPARADRAQGPPLVRPVAGGGTRRRVPPEPPRRAAGRARLAGAASPRHDLLPDLRVPERRGAAVRPAARPGRVPTVRRGRGADPSRPVGGATGVRPPAGGAGLMARWSERTRGVLGAVRAGNASARALSVADSRSFVRSQFLAAAVRVDLLPFLQAARSTAEIAEHLGSRRADRLAKLPGRRGRARRARSGRRPLPRGGRRARAIAGGDALLTAHYRSMLDYQTSPYVELASLLRDEPGAGLTDLDEHAAVIADVSLAAVPFVTPMLERVVTEHRPTHALDVGCGTGVYTQLLLDADPLVQVDGIDLAADVVDDCRRRLGTSSGVARWEVHVGDVRTWVPPGDRRYDLITLNNNIYYFAAAERVGLARHLRSLLAPAGELVVVTMLRPGSIASAHMHFMLVAQTGSAALPSRGELEADLRSAGFATIEVDDLVPTEPFVGIRAR